MKAPLDVGVAFYRISPPSTQGMFGASVAVTTRALAVSAPFENVTVGGRVLERAGATYLYDLEAGASSHQRIVNTNVDSEDGSLPPELEVPGELQAPFPWPATSLALSDDTLVIGVPAEASARADDPSDNSAPYAGAVYVYHRSAPDAAPDATQYLKAPNAEGGDLFGYSISLSSSFLVVGAPREGGGDATHPSDNTAPLSGAVYIYSRSADGGILGAPYYLKAPSISANATFGSAVAVYEDRLVVSAHTESLPGAGVDGDTTVPSFLHSGTVYMYRRTATGWEVEHTIKSPNPEAGALFGSSLSSLSATSFVVGSVSATGCGTATAATINQGAAYFIHETNGTWVEDCVEPDSGGAQVLFGWSVAADGDRFVVGAPWDASNNTTDPTDQSTRAAGAGYAFRTTPDGLVKTYFKAPQPKYSGFGFSLGMAGDRIVVGAPYEYDPEMNVVAPPPNDDPLPSGAVYVFAPK